MEQVFPRREEEEMTIDGYLKGSERSHNQKKEFSRDSSGRLSMEKLSRASEDWLTELACEYGWFIDHNGQR